MKAVSLISKNILPNSLIVRWSGSLTICDVTTGRLTKIPTTIYEPLEAMFHCIDGFTHDVLFRGFPNYEIYLVLMEYENYSQYRWGLL